MFKIIVSSGGDRNLRISRVFYSYMSFKKLEKNTVHVYPNISLVINMHIGRIKTSVKNIDLHILILLATECVYSVT